MKQKLLFATTNPAKIQTYKSELERRGFEVVTLKDLNLNLKVQETGKNSIENAYIKSKAYNKATGITTISMDNSLFIEDIPEELQPGTYVRRVNGKELTDDEMLEYYTNLVKQYGGKLTAKWIFGFVICNGENEKEYSYAEGDFYFVDKPCQTRVAGYPLDSISVSKETNKYWVDLTDEEKKKSNECHIQEVVDFIESFV